MIYATCFLRRCNGGLFGWVGMFGLSTGDDFERCLWRAGGGWRDRACADAVGAGAADRDDDEHGNDLTGRDGDDQCAGGEPKVSWWESEWFEEWLRLARP